MLWPQAVRKPSIKEFESQVSGRPIQEVGRRAKYLLFKLARRPKRTLVLHLRMSGSLLVQPAEGALPRHTRNVILLDGGLRLCFVDPRKLGTMWLVKDEAEVVAGLGPEPLGPAFTPQVLAQAIADRHAPIKALLCDQAIVAGLGNIYADEVLFLARVRPLKAGGLLSAEEVRRVHQAIVTRLPQAIEALAPLAAIGEPPTESEEGLELLLVLRSEGAPCTGCGTSIERVTIRGRSSYYCPRCQRD